MKVIVTGRRGGKTTQAIKLAAEHFAYIVCRSLNEAHRIAEQAREMRLDIPLPITYSEFLKGNFYGFGVKAFVVEDVEFMLQHYFAKHVPIVGVTLTEEE